MNIPNNRNTGAVGAAPFLLLKPRGNHHETALGIYRDPDHVCGVVSVSAAVPVLIAGALMPRASIDYLNARRAILPASGGKTQSRAVKYAPETTLDPADQAMKYIGDFSLWAEITRQQLVARLAIPQAEPETEIPF